METVSNLVDDIDQATRDATHYNINDKVANKTYQYRSKQYVDHINIPGTVGSVDASKVTNFNTIDEQVANKTYKYRFDKNENKKAKTKFIQNENKRHTKVIQEARSKAAAAEHVIQTDKAKRKPYIHTNKASRERNNMKMKRDSNLKIDSSNIKATTKKGFNWENSKQHMMKSEVGKRFFNKKGAVLLAGMIAGAVTLTHLGSKYGNAPLVTAPRIGQFNARSSYIPDSYKRGYSDIKEALTDFGSRVHLEKTIKQLITPFNSTRNGIRTNVAAMYNHNVSLSMHKNAINHMRY